MREGDRIPPNRTRFTVEGLSPERVKRIIAGIATAALIPAID